jgi:uncharacterized protein YlxP (DUF503 family)
MVIGRGVIELHLPGIRSLKEKRSVLKRLIAQLHKEFNVSCGEIALHDVWQSSAIGVAVVSTAAPHAENVLENVVKWIEHNQPHVMVVDHGIEIIH